MIQECWTYVDTYSGTCVYLILLKFGEITDGSGCALDNPKPLLMSRCSERLLMFSQKQKDSTQRMGSGSPPPDRLRSLPRYGAGIPVCARAFIFHSYSLSLLLSLLLHTLHRSIVPSFCLHHCICTPRSPPLLLLLPWLAPWLCLWRCHIKHIKRPQLPVSAFLYMHVCFACHTIHACTFVCSLPREQSLFLHREHSLVLFFFPWKLYSPEEVISQRIHHSLHDARVRKYHVCSVSSYVPRACLGCCGGVFSCYACWLFSVFPSASLSPSRACVSFCRPLSHCHSQSLSLFVPAGFVPPARTYAPERQWGSFYTAYMWLPASGSLSPGLWASLERLPPSTWFSN